MGRRTRWLLPLLLGVAHAGDPIADHDKAHGRPELARVGTIGDRPPPESTLVVHVHADGAIVVEGKALRLRELAVALAEFRDEKAEPSVLLRSDARLPWVAWVRVLETCAEQKLRRIFHAVLPEVGEEEGAFFWPLPPDSPSAEGTGSTLPLVLDFRRQPAEAAHLYWAAREAKPDDVTLHVGLAVPAGVLLHAADALRRAGVRTAGMSPPVPPPDLIESWSDLKRIVKNAPTATGMGIAIRLADEPLGGAKAEAMPPVDRVRGGFAGFAFEKGGAEEHDVAFRGPATNPAPGTAGKRGRGAMRVTENAVELGLKWLADHQDADGKWDCDGFANHDPADDKCDGRGAAPHDVGVTGLALLAFLGAGYTDRKPSENPYADNVRRGLRYLIASHDEMDGVFGKQDTPRALYNHVIATLAMCEAYWMTRNPRYKLPAQNGLNRIAMARNPQLAWRYVPRGGDNDTSVTAWCVMALKAGKFAGLEVDPDALRGAREWIDRMTDPETGRVGYMVRGGLPERTKGAEARWPPARSQSMTAAGILTRIFLGEDPRSSEEVRKGAKLCVEMPPVWNPDNGSIDMYYWYLGTLALFQVGGRPWDIWNKAMNEAILKHQHQKGTGSRTGSWDPLDPWGADGGRVYSTALMTMCLEVYYRYDRR